MAKRKFRRTSDQTESQAACIYAYGAKAPIEGADVVDQQIQLAHRYRNERVRIELDRRAKVDAYIESACPTVKEARLAIESADSQIAQIDAEIKSRNAQTRRNNPVLMDARMRRAELVSARKTAREQHKALRSKAFKDPAIKDRLRSIDAEFNERMKKFRREESGLWCGNYGLVDETARDIKAGAPPKFRHWDGYGRVGGQALLTAEQAVECQDSHVRIQMMGPKYAVVWIRVGSTEDRGPVWAKFPAVIHRPLPAGATIKWAYAIRRRVGTRYKWEVQFSLRCDQSVVRSAKVGSGSVKLTTNWFRMDDGSIHVASWAGSDGAEGFVAIGASDLARWSKCDELQAIRDVNFDTARAALRAWINGGGKPDCVGEFAEYLEYRRQEGKPHLVAEHAAWVVLAKKWEPVQVPLWMVESTEHLHAWRDKAKLEKLLQRWRVNRFGGDDAIFAAMEAWSRRDRHLWDWQASNREKAANWRDNLYRNVASMLSRKYAVCEIADTNWAGLLAEPEPDEPDSTKAMRKLLKLAAIGTFKRFIAEKMTCHETKAVRAVASGDDSATDGIASQDGTGRGDDDGGCVCCEAAAVAAE